MADEGLWVVINHEEQYSIWPADKDLPRNWKSTGVKGDRERCMRYYIEEVWTDMRPIVMNSFRG
jgi:MbtH protein